MTFGLWRQKLVEAARTLQKILEPCRKAAACAAGLSAAAQHSARAS